jgi:2-polyprenyl-6-methoxyphenol hydroxylase-like FAD-dependent oxidoreductase
MTYSGEEARDEVAIIGAGIAGLTLGLCLHEKGIAARIYEKTPEIRPLGVGINVLPHASRVLHALGLGEALAALGVRTRESSFFNRFGQHILTDPLGLAAGYATPQYSIHRGDLQQVLIDAFVARAGAGRLALDAGCTGYEQNGDSLRLHFEQTSTGAVLPDVAPRCAVGCDGIHSVIRKQLHPNEGDPRYSGVNMWRGVTRMPPILSGATMVRAGWLDTGKLVAYPIRDYDDGTQLQNWVAEIEMPLQKHPRDWTRPGRLEDFLPAFADWRFDWLDVPKMFTDAELVLDYPMVDQDPLPFWSDGRVTLMGDAAHPMVPRGSNGAGQAILDADCLAVLLAEEPDTEEALKRYEQERLDATTRVVLTNRVAPPDTILKAVLERTGDRPFDDIDAVISRDELQAIIRRYQEVAGYDLQTLRAKSAQLATAR